MDEKKMMGVLKNLFKGDEIDYSKISDFSKLISLWKKTSSGSKSEKLIEQRIGDLLPGISDFSELIFLWEETSSDSEPRKLIEQRIADVLSGISADNIYSFADFIEKEEIPKGLRELFESKVEALIAELQEED